MLNGTGLGRPVAKPYFQPRGVCLGRGGAAFLGTYGYDAWKLLESERVPVG